MTEEGQESMELVKRDGCSHKGPRKNSEATRSPEESTGGKGSRFGLSKLALVLSASNTLIFLNRYFVLPASVSPLTRELLASFLSQTVPLMACLRPNPQF